MPNPSPIVLVVDAVAQRYTESALAGHAAALTAADTVLEAARAADVHVLHTHLQFRADGLDGGHYYRRNADLVAFAGRPFSPALVPMPDELVVPRTYPSAFFGTSLPATIRGVEADTVLLVGSTTSGSVRATAIDVMQHGFRPVIVDQAVADVTPSLHADALQDLRRHYADVLSVPEVVGLLRGAHRQ